MTDEKIRALIAELRSAAGAGREGTHAGYSPLLRGADLATRAADALEALTVPDGDAREQLIDVLVMTDLSDYAGTDMGMINAAADAILAAFPALSRDIAGEIEAEAADTEDGYGYEAYINGLLRGAEIARSGR